MNYFFGLEPMLSQEVRFFFNSNHLLLVLIVIGILLALYFGLHAKTKKGN